MHALVDQGFQGVRGHAGVQIQHQPMLVSGDRGQGKDLRRNLAFQVNHQPHHAGAVLSHAHTGNVGVVRSHLAHQLAQRAIEFQALNVNGQARRGRNEGLRRLQRGV